MWQDVSQDCFLFAAYERLAGPVPVIGKITFVGTFVEQNSLGEHMWVCFWPLFCFVDLNISL
jgi:hypothetical protein